MTDEQLIRALAAHAALVNPSGGVMLHQQISNNENVIARAAQIGTGVPWIDGAPGEGFSFVYAEGCDGPVAVVRRGFPLPEHIATYNPSWGGYLLKAAPQPIPQG